MGVEPCQPKHFAMMMGSFWQAGNLGFSIRAFTFLLVVPTHVFPFINIRRSYEESNMVRRDGDHPHGFFASPGGSKACLVQYGPATMLRGMSGCVQYRFLPDLVLLRLSARLFHVRYLGSTREEEGARGFPVPHFVSREPQQKNETFSFNECRCERVLACGPSGGSAQCH